MQEMPMAKSNARIDHDDFVYTLSHNLKEPLRGVSILSSILLTDYEGKTLDADGLQMLKRLSFLSQRADKMISDLLVFSRLRHAQPVAEKINMEGLIQDLRHEMASLLSEEKANIVISTPLQDVVHDKSRLSDMLKRLIGNAVKYNDKENKVIEIGMRDMQTPHGFYKNVLFVKDNGIGIEAQSYQKAFGVFVRLPGADKYDANGTGIGLTAVKEMVEQGHGHVWLESKPGEGSVFYLLLKEE